MRTRDVFALFSDGIVESANAIDEHFGVDRVPYSTATTLCRTQSYATRRPGWMPPTDKQRGQNNRYIVSWLFRTPILWPLWWHYEELAMHFNGLIMQFRLQVLGGAGAIGTLAGYLINSGKVEGLKKPNRLRAVVASGLWVLILAAAMLDVFYYRQLLKGAVQAILDFEREHPEIQMSTQIERTVGQGKYVIFCAYGILISVLGIFTLWAWIRSWNTASEARAFLTTT